MPLKELKPYGYMVKLCFKFRYLYEIYLLTTYPLKAAAQHLLGAPFHVHCRIPIYLPWSLVKHELLKLLDKQECDTNFL